MPAAGAAALVVAVLVVALGPTPPLAAAVVAVVGLAVGAWATLRLRAERIVHETAVARWAAAQAVLSERLAIARDLHDLVSHGLGLITVRAATARFTNTGQPDTDDLLQALADVEATSRQATAELRRMLHALRESTDPAPLQPADSLDTVPQIVSDARRAGLEVTLDAGDLPRVSPVTQVAICAVVREGLANAARHAGATTATVQLTTCDGSVVVTVTDTGPSDHWQPALGAGHGLIGLQERVTTLGGTLAGEPHGAGYRLTARLPHGDV